MINNLSPSPQCHSGKVTFQSKNQGDTSPCHFDIYTNSKNKEEEISLASLSQNLGSTRPWLSVTVTQLFLKLKKNMIAPCDKHRHSDTVTF